MARSWFPELMRFESRPERKKAWRAAYHPVLKSLRYWLIAIATQLVGQVVFRALGSQCAGWLEFTRGWAPFVAPGVGAGIAAALTLWLVRKRVQRNLREHLNDCGQPVCLHCGYDLTGNTSGRCPECGRRAGRQDG
ncbi:MAG: hypothetical protein ACYSUI_01060 [Planctomycetota bacterium]